MKAGLILGTLAVSFQAWAHQFYNESLEITPLPRNRVLTSFQFDVKSGALEFDTDVKATEHYTYFPKALGPVVESAKARELHLRFGQGWWDEEQWGKLPHNGTRVGGTGVEVYAVLEARDLDAAKLQWFSLTKTLSGFFCASLNFIDDATTTMPKYVVDEGDAILMDPKNHLFLLKASLPSEPICTENLTPFLKLLPTRGKAGISSLLDGHKLFDSLWHAMSIDITTQCTDEECNLSMQQTVSAVIDVNRSIRKQQQGGIPKPVPGDEMRCDTSKKHDVWTCFPLNESQNITYSMHTVFGKYFNGAAFGDATESKVIVNVNPESWKVEFSQANSDVPTAVFSRSSRVERYLAPKGEQDIKFECEDNNLVAPIDHAPLSVARSLTGYSQDKGGIRASFTNKLNTTTKFVYSETLPWFMKLHMHTLSLTSSSPNPEDWVLDQFYRPSIDRLRPSRIEFIMEIPPLESVTLSFKFHKSLLLIHEYPPDANHGFAVDPAVIQVIDPNTETTSYEFRTTSLLLTLPVPDFSMPYNVIILTCTVMSLAFGSIFNLLIKKVVTEQEYQEVAKNSGLGKLKQKVQRLKAIIKRN